MTTHTRRSFLGTLASTALVASAGRGTAAASYPSRPITMIVPFPAGGPTDAIGRVAAEGMRATLGQPVIVEDLGGAAGSLGTERVARAKPDGYMIGLGNSVTHVLNGAIYQLNYDVVKDFSPISLLVREPALIVAKHDLPVNNLRELIAWLKANSDKALAGTGGVGTVSDVAAVFFAKRTETKFQSVPYRGLGPAIEALVAGQVDFVMSLPANALPQVQAGSIKALAVTSNTRMIGAPNIPTVDETGLQGFYQSNWHALFAPKNTPTSIIETLNAAVRATLADPDMRRRFVAMGQDFFPADKLTPAALAVFQKQEIEERWPIVKAAGIKAG